MSTIRHNIGDKVIALTNPLNDMCQNRVKGKTYIVVDCVYCTKCGTQSINIGELSIYPESECVCGNISLSGGKYWTDSMYFSNANNIEEALSESIKKEDYELASLLRDTKIN